MDELFQPIRTTLQSGLTVITMRTEREGLLGGEVRIGFGSAQAAKIDPYWQGLPHYTEHMILFGASRKYKASEIQHVMRDKFHTFHNGWTNQTETRYFTNGQQGHVLPKRLFWDAFTAAVDGLFFPIFDTISIERERKRIFNEVSQTLTQLALDDMRFNKLMFGPDYLQQAVIGTRYRNQRTDRKL